MEQQGTQKVDLEKTKESAIYAYTKICAVGGITGPIERLRGKTFVFRAIVEDAYLTVAGVITTASFAAIPVYEEPEVAPKTAEGAGPDPRAFLVLTTDALVPDEIKGPSEMRSFSLFLYDVSERWTCVLGESSPEDDVLWSDLAFPDDTAFGSSPT